jgi:hypothetical protein
MNKNTEQGSRAAEWRAKSRKAALERAEEITLPSGMTITARRLGPSQLATFGQLPLHLATHVAAGRDDEIPEQTPEKTIAMMEFLRDVLVFCVVDPPISLTPASNEIHPRDIDDADLNYIMAYAMGREEAARFESFRGKRADGSSGGGSSDVERATFPTPRHQGSAAGFGSGPRRDGHLAQVEE